MHACNVFFVCIWLVSEREVAVHSAQRTGNEDVRENMEKMVWLPKNKDNTDNKQACAHGR